VSKEFSECGSTCGQAERELEFGGRARRRARISLTPHVLTHVPRRAVALVRGVSAARPAPRARRNWRARAARKCQLAKTWQAAVLAIARGKISCWVSSVLVGAPATPSARLDC